MVDAMPTPTPKSGQLLVRTLHCGICGSDLHCLHGMAAMADYGRRTGVATGDMDPNRDLVFGHEFCAEIVEFGPDTERKLKPGALVCAMPSVFDPEGMQALGFSNKYPGGFGEYMILSEKLTYPVTNGLDSKYAAMTEPTAVAVHAVNRTDHGHNAYMVIGCGPVGLSIILELKARGLGPIIASDLMAERRQMAERLGADIVIDAGKIDPKAFWADFFLQNEVRGETKRRRAVMYECVGVPGMMNAVINAAPAGAQLVICGVCMAPDQIEPSIAMNKELDIKFAIGYSRREFTGTLERLCAGEIDVAPLISDVIGLESVANAFEELLSKPKRVKILVDPRL